MDKCTESKVLTGLLIIASSRWWTRGFSLRFRNINDVCPFVSAAEAGLFKDGDGDQHSPHRPVAHHWCHAEWLWGIQPEVRLWGRLRLLPRLDAPRLPAEGQGQRVDINSHMLRSNHLCLPNPHQEKKRKKRIYGEDGRRRVPPQALSWKRWSGEITPRPCRARITWLYLTRSNGSEIRKKGMWGRAGQRGSSQPEHPHPTLLPTPTHPPTSSLWMLLVLLWIQPQRCLCEESQNNQGAKTQQKKA